MLSEIAWECRIPLLAGELSDAMCICNWASEVIVWEPSPEHLLLFASIRASGRSLAAVKAKTTFLPVTTGQPFAFCALIAVS